MHGLVDDEDSHYAQPGAIGEPLLADQTKQAWCLTVLTNAVITWTTEYYQIAVQDLRAKGGALTDEIHRRVHHR